MARKVRSRTAEKPKNLRKTLQMLFGYTKQFRIVLFIAFLLNILNAFAKIHDTTIFKTVIDDYILPLSRNYTEELFSGFIQILFTVAGWLMIGLLSEYFSERIMISISSKYVYKIRQDLFNKMEQLPLVYFDKNKHGDVMNLYTTDVEYISYLISDVFLDVSFAIIRLFIVLSIMFYYNWQLTSIFLFCFLLLLFPFVRITGRIKEYFKSLQDKLGKMQGYIEEMFQGQKVVKVFTHKQQTKQQFSKINEDFRLISTKANIYGNMSMPVMSNLFFFIYILILILGAIYTMNNQISVGTFLTYVNLLATVEFPLISIATSYNGVLMALSGAERVFNVLEKDDEIDEGTVAIEEQKSNGEIKLFWKINNQLKEVKGNIEFKNVNFRYEETGKNVLTNINLTAEAGKTIALVGSTGAGKTTIINLINRFYDIQSGEILFDNINIKDIKKSALRKATSIVLQDTHLFTASVLENIRYGNPTATDEEVIKSAKLSNADYFIQNLPNKYDTILTADGSNLSQGEKQLITIARALVADPDVLILDEATSSVDTRTEKLIEKGIEALTKNRTVFIIAHRLSTVRNADLILVLEKGEIIETGNHQQLLEQKGRYYQLYTGGVKLE